jgi:hypothetical protein
MSCNSVFDYDDRVAHIDTMLQKIAEIQTSFAENREVKGKDRRRLITWGMWFCYSGLLLWITFQKHEDIIHTAAKAQVSQILCANDADDEYDVFQDATQSSVTAAPKVSDEIP